MTEGLLINRRLRVVLVAALIAVSSKIKAATGQSLQLGCPLKVVVDPFLWKEYRSREDEGVEGDLRARFSLTSLVSRLVNSANRVLTSNYFGDKKYGLILQEIEILDDSKCSILGFNVCSLDLSLTELLNQLSYIDHSLYCLSYLVTFRDFPGGSLGLAWTASGENGGVCDTHRAQVEPLSYLLANKSLNTGVVSLSRNGLPVSERVAALTFTHEVAHSFGAPHDTASLCPAGPEGEHLMAENGSLGLRAANMQLSQCSIDAMAQLLPSRRGCWRVNPLHGVCGNSVVEGWEECDCGSDPNLCQALCCVPSTLNPGDGRTPCTRTRSASCSPSEGVCCTSNCTFAQAEVECKAATDCSEASTCSGTAAICPSATAQAEGRECDGGARTCSRGACTGSACQTLGLLPCPTPLTNDSTEACTAHCQHSEGTCAPAFSLVLPDGEECRQAGGFGHCSAGSCSVGGGAHASWVVGVAGCLIAYTLLALVVIWCYCAYCRGGRRS